nr:hypothetical protein [Tanacetum cinerariifolium]
YAVDDVISHDMNGCCSVMTDSTHDQYGIVCLVLICMYNSSPADRKASALSAALSPPPSSMELKLSQHYHHFVLEIHHFCSAKELPNIDCLQLSE